MVSSSQVAIGAVDVFYGHVGEAVGGYFLGEASEGTRGRVVFSSYCKTWRLGQLTRVF